jgi:hypothetical protein
MSAAFDEEMLQLLRREFFASVPEKQFFQERNLLLQAVTYPADYLHRRGAALPATQYRAILQTVIDTIKEYGNRKRIRRFSAYFLDCVQKHMQHHGEEYYIEAKQARVAGSVAAGELGKLRPDEPGRDVVRDLVAIRRALRSKGGRKKADANLRTGELELF